jgi:hypothetical protein
MSVRASLRRALAVPHHCLPAARRPVGVTSRKVADWLPRLSAGTLQRLRAWLLSRLGGRALGTEAAMADRLRAFSELGAFLWGFDYAPGVGKGARPAEGGRGRYALASRQQGARVLRRLKR